MNRISKMLLCSALIVGGYAMAETTAGDRYYRIDEFQIDRPTAAKRAAWMKANSRHNTYAIDCAHLTGQTNAYDHVAATEVPKYRCDLSLLSYDIAERSLIVFVDIVYGNFVLARYPAKITGEATEFFGSLNRERLSDDAALNSLGQALTQMLRTNEAFGQDRYTDGQLRLTSISTEAKIDPLSQHPRRSDLPVMTWEGTKVISFHDEDGVLTYKILAASDPTATAKIEVLYSAVANTLRILEDGYRQLQVNSSAENQQRLRQAIADNATTISGELKTLAGLIREQKVHIMETIHFLNQFGSLVRATDAILKGEVGTEPGFFTSIREN